MAVVVPGPWGNRAPKKQLVVALVTSIWRCTKQPKLVTARVPLAQVIAFRCTELEPLKRSVGAWAAREDSKAWVLKPETLAALLAPQEDGVELATDYIEVQLSGESVAMLDELRQVSDWWPDPEQDDEGEPTSSTAIAGLFLSGRSARKRKQASGVANRGKWARRKEGQATDNGKKKGKGHKKGKKDKKEIRARVW